MILTSTGLDAKGLNSKFMEGFRGHDPIYPTITTAIKTNTKTEDFRFLGHVPGMREWGTGRKVHTLAVESYSITAEKYELTLGVERDEIDDDQTGQIELRFKDMGRRAAQNPDKLCMYMLNNGDNAALVTSYDGKALFADDHVSHLSGSQDNLLTLDVSTVDSIDSPDTPTMAHIRKGLQNAMGAMLGYKDDQGEPVVTSLDGLVAVVHPSVYLAWQEAIATTTVLGTEFRGNKWSGIRVVPNYWSTVAAKWHLLSTNVDVGALVFLDRSPIEFGAVGPGSEQGFKTETYLYGIRARYAVKPGRPLAAVQTTFT